MTAQKHTEGPWVFEDYSQEEVEFFVIPATYHGTVAKVYREADARLIAASPDMLVALQDLLLAYSEPDQSLCCDGRDCGCMGSTVRQQAEHYARRAIAKATGQ